MTLRKHLAEFLVVTILCLIFVGLVASFARSSSATFDETSHLPAGYSYLRWHDYRLNPEHPPLVKKLAALPLLWENVWPATPPEPARGDGDDQLIALAWSAALPQIDAQWSFGHEFLYGVKTEKLAQLHEQNSAIVNGGTVPSTLQLEATDFHNNADQLLFRGRMAVMFLGLTLLLLLYWWAREMFGPAGAILAALLLCFDPNVIAHSGLVTTDVGETLFIFGTLFFLWQCWHRFNAVNMLLFILCFALAFVTKFSAIALLPICGLIGLALAGSPATWTFFGLSLTTRANKAVAMLGLFTLTLLATWLVIWASYDFRYAAAHGPEPTALPIEAVLRRTAAIRAELRTWPNGIPADKQADFEPRIREEMTQVPLTVSGRVILFARQYRLLPEAYLFGIAHTEMKSLLRGSFLFGQYSHVGFRSYFFWTFLLKTPLPALLLIIAGITVAVRRRTRFALLFILIPIGIYLFISIAAHLNIGHRHILLIYPLLYLLCGTLAAEWQRLPRTWRHLSAILVVGAVVTSSQFVFSPLGHPQKVAPHFLAYFNEFAGGPRQGYRALVDSNLDWGQDLTGLKSWIDQNQIGEPIWLSYFGMADPRYYGIRHFNVPRVLGGYPFESSAYDELEAQGKPGDAAQKFVGDLQAGQYIAVSATNFSGVYLGQPVHDLWQQIFNHSTFVDQIGYSIFIYRLNDH
jgi:Dolichyl-phosphate-mannose-protein mannosyltransferase